MASGSEEASIWEGHDPVPSPPEVEAKTWRPYQKRVLTRTVMVWPVSFPEKLVMPR